MADPQGLILYPNVAKPTGGSYTLSHGISAGSFVLQFTPQQNTVPEYGTVQITFGNTLIEFPDCKLVAPSSQFNESGQLISITVLDRRWRWRFGNISGRYNIRTPQGGIQFGTEKTPQELATLLLQTMGEVGFDVSQLPNTARPEIDWDYDNPSQELAELCETLGCRVVLGTDNKTKLCLKGQGQSLPNNGKEITIGFGIDAGVRPSSLLFVAGPTKYQTRFKLEAVGLTRDGSYLPIDQLPYKPTAGWEKEFPPSFTGVLDQHGVKEHQLAQRSVFRMYRIKGTAPTGNNFTFNYFPNTAERLEDILPVEDSLVIQTRGIDGIYRPSPAVVRGRFWKDDTIQATDNLGDANQHYSYHKSFSVNQQQGIVEFADPVILIEGNEIKPADLTLECAHAIRLATTRQVYRWTRQRQVPGVQFPTAPQTIPVDEAFLWVIQQYDQTSNPLGVTTNEETIEPEADGVLTDALAELQQPQSYELVYTGLLDINPDGAIQQVGWQFGIDGAFTSASLNTEFDLESPSFEERRRREREGRAKRNAKKVIGVVKKWVRAFSKFGR